MSGQNTANRSLLRVRLSNKEQTAYPALFAQADPKNTGKVEGRTAVEFFRNSNLSVETLREVWNISTPGGEGFLDRDRFYVALRLIALAQHGKPATAQSIAANVEVDLPRFGPAEAEGFDLTPEDRQKFETIFANNFPGKTVITGQEARQLFSRTGVGHTDLVKIWNLSDPQDTGVLSKNQFLVAMQLMLKVRQHVKIPDVLPKCLQAVIAAAPSKPQAQASPPDPKPAPKPAPVSDPEDSQLRAKVELSEAAEKPSFDPEVIRGLTAASQDILQAVKSLERRVEELSTELKATKSEVKSLKDASVQRQSETFTLVEEVLRGQKRAANEEKESFEAVVRALREEVSGLQVQSGGRSESGQELAEIRAELGGLKLVKADISGLREDLRVLAEVRDQFGEVQSQIEGLRKDFGAINDVKEQLVSVEGQLSDLESRQGEVRQQQDFALKKLEVLSTEVGGVAAKLEEEGERWAQRETKPASPKEEKQPESRQFNEKAGGLLQDEQPEEAQAGKFTRVNDPFAMPPQGSNPMLNSDPFDFEALSQPTKPATERQPSERSPRVMTDNFAFDEEPVDSAGHKFEFSDGKAGAPRSPHQPDFDFILGKPEQALSSPKEGGFPFESPEEGSGKEIDPFQFSPGEGDKQGFDFVSQDVGKGFGFEDKEDFEEAKGSFDFQSEKKPDLDFNF